MVVICTAIAAKASDYPYMVIRGADGTENYVKSDGLRFTVAGGQLMVSHADGSASFTISELSSMAFATNLSGVDEVMAVEGRGVEVYTVMGLSVGKFESTEAAREGIAVPGVYLLKGEKVTTKILIKK